MKTIVRVLAVTISLAAASFAGVTVSSPTAGSSDASPVHVVASATASNPITFMRIYVDNVSVYGIAAAKIDTNVAMTAASHDIVVQAWDSKGAVYKQSVLITVKASPSPTPTPTPTPTPKPSPTPTPTPTPTPKPSPTPTPTPTPTPLPLPPASAVVISNIDQITGWQSCAACAGAAGNGPVSPISMLENQLSPSLDGKSAKFSITPTAPYSDALWWKQLGPVNTATHFKFDLYFYLTTPQVSQALEFDMNQANGSMRWIFGTQCNIKGGGHWDIWGNADGKWLSTGVPCSVPAAFIWHHLTWEFKRTATTLTFIGFTYDGVTHYLNITHNAKASSVSELNAAFQMDGNSAMTAYSTWLDKISVTYW